MDTEGIMQRLIAAATGAFGLKIISYFNDRQKIRASSEHSDRAEIIALRKEVKALNDRVDRWQERYFTLSELHSQCEARTKILQDHIDRLSTEVASLRSQVNHLSKDTP